MLTTKKYPFVFIGYIVGIILIASSSYASVIQINTLSETARGSALIFEGQVISKQVRTTSAGKPFTYFTFKILDVLKGTYSRPTIELGYLGGTTPKGLLLRVSDMRMPAIGEHGIYFVESLSQQQVHPLFGWQQGHYLVITPQAGKVARVVPVDQLSSAMTAAPSLSQFKQQLRSLLESGK